MKTAIEEVVQRDIGTLEYIMILSQSNSWVYVSKDLLNFLEETFDNHKFYRDNGSTFQDESGNIVSIITKKENLRLEWNEVASYSKDPDSIYFLS